MIQLTQEQWQAISAQETPTLINPESKTAYVIVAKEKYEQLRAVSATEAEAACVLRIAWMRRMGLDEDEIAEAVRDDPPLNIREEMKQLRALDNLDHSTPTAEVLRQYAIKY